ncbi:nucleolin-like [Diadema antillarum]|uniref:nucleolin-like n=1 Tax=Diadema antillarum TaxID=105358 RepID=UPI003A844213
MDSRQRRRSESEDDRTLFVKGLCYSTTEETLVDTFRAVSARIPLNNQGRSKGFAYIEFEDERSVDDAMDAQQGIEIDGWTLTLDYVGHKRRNFEESGGGGGGRSRASGGGGGGRDRDRDGGRRFGGSYGFKAGGGGGGGRGGYDSRPRGGGRDSNQNRTLYVKGIPYDATEDSLIDLLGCVSVRIPKYRDSDDNKGFAYADFEDHASAQDAIDQLTGQDDLLLEFARERRGGGGGGGGGARGGFGSGGGGSGYRDSDRSYRSSRQDDGDYDSQNRTVYVKGIAEDATEDDLMDLLGCSTVRIPRHPDTDEIKGFAYADFDDHEAAQNAIDTLSGTDNLFMEFARERGGGRGRRRGGFRGGRRGGGGGYNGY